MEEAARQLISVGGNTPAIRATPKYASASVLNGHFRGSKYRGVSKNGPRYQVYITINKIKKYVALFYTEKDAAIVYDELSIRYNGLKVSLLSPHLT